MEDKIQRPSIMKRLRHSAISRLAFYLSIGKFIVIFAPYSLSHSPNYLQHMSTIWDSNYYQLIATKGYGPNTAPYVFSPVYPFLIRLANFFIGNAWISALVATNVLSFLFPILVYKTFGFKTALVTEVFPTYLLFTTIPYSDVVALLFLAASILLLANKKVIFASGSLSVAIATFFNLVLTFPSFLFALLKEKQVKKTLMFSILPVATGIIILLWFKIETGNYYYFFQAEKAWQVGFGTPIEQALYLLCPTGKGTFTCEAWSIRGVILKPVYWLIRNLIFEVFYLFGAFYLLLKTKIEQRLFLFIYSLSVIIPLFFVLGFAAMSIPRLLLPAFPIFAAYSALMNKSKYVDLYTVLCFAIAATISVIQYFAIFS